MANPIADTGPAIAEDKLPGLSYRIYILILLTCVSVISAIDRQIIDILVVPISEEFDLTDGQIGGLVGIAYSSMFALSAIPLARLGDRYARRTVIAVCAVFWSAATAISGAAQSYVQLFIARMGVGLGEAGLSSPGPALLSDLWPRKSRGTVVSLYMLGPPIGIGIALAVGGWIVEHYGWRLAFLLAGLPGIIIAPLIYFTVKDFRKGLADGMTQKAEQPSILHTLKTLFGLKTLVFMVAAVSLQGIIAGGAQRLVPTFLSRYYDLSPVEYGAALGIALPLGNFFGHLLGGPLADLVGRRNMKYQMYVGIAAVLFGAVTTFWAFSLPSLEIFYVLIAVQTFLAGLFAAPLIMICTSLPPVWARATTAAIALMAIYLVGFGLGPWIIGELSDVLGVFYGDQSLRMAILWVLVLAVPSALLFFAASRVYVRELADAERALAAEVAHNNASRDV